jgi:hypothetical protein
MERKAFLKEMILVLFWGWTEGMLGLHGIKGMVGRDHVSIFSDPNQRAHDSKSMILKNILFHEIRAPRNHEY